LLVQTEVGSVVVIVGNVLGDESLQMALIQRDYVVE
jgi:ribosomal protein L18E